MSGVYALVHIPSDSAYVGASKRSIYNRFSWHRTMLKQGIHTSPKLQSLWNITDSEEWEFRIVEKCDPGDCEDAEQRWCEKFTVLLCEHPATGFTHPVETRIKIKANRQHYMDDPETRKSLSERAKAQHASGKFGRSTWTPGKQPNRDPIKMKRGKVKVFLRRISENVNNPAGQKFWTTKLNNYDPNCEYR